MGLMSFYIFVNFVKLYNCNSCGKVKMSLKESQDFENILYPATDLFNKSDYHFNEFMKLKEQCGSMRNYIKRIRTTHCLNV